MGNAVPAVPTLLLLGTAEPETASNGLEEEHQLILPEGDSRFTDGMHAASWEAGGGGPGTCRPSLWVGNVQGTLSLGHLGKARLQRAAG